MTYPYFMDDLCLLQLPRQWLHVEASDGWTIRSTFTEDIYDSSQRIYGNVHLCAFILDQVYESTGIIPPTPQPPITNPLKTHEQEP